MVEILVTILLGILVIYVVHIFIGTLNLPGNAKQIVYLIVAVIALIWLLDLFGLYEVSRFR